MSNDIHTPQTSESGNTIPPIDASPTKEFFISVLVRDVTLYEAISELVDNSVDGAKSIRGQAGYDGLKIEIEFDENHFKISDTCGGIPAEVAAEYVFRFGRAVGMPSSDHPIGQFGVGMKRALFKMGSCFEVESTAPKSSFSVLLDVEQWKKATYPDNPQKEKWEFDFVSYHINQNNPVDECGTKISVKPLHEHIAEEFKLENFEYRLIKAIEAEQMESLQKGLEIYINGHRLQHEEATLLESSDVKPYYEHIDVELDGKKVGVDIYAGVSEANLEKCGWYIICNGRLILKADKTRITGWDEKPDKANIIESDEKGDSGNISTPKPHYQFARFRGYVYFIADAASADLLPWNTTKSTVDVENPIYQAVKQKMIRALRQAVDFLNKLDAELDRGETHLDNILKEAKSAKVKDIAPSAFFVHPPPKPAPAKPKSIRIQYVRPPDEVEKAKALLGVSTPKEVGEGTFDYFLEMEGD